MNPTIPPIPADMSGIVGTADAVDLLRVQLHRVDPGVLSMSVEEAVSGGE